MSINLQLPRLSPFTIQSTEDVPTQGLLTDLPSNHTNPTKKINQPIESHVHQPNTSTKITTHQEIKQNIHQIYCPISQPSEQNSTYNKINQPKTIHPSINRTKKTRSHETSKSPDQRNQPINQTIQLTK
jgi:hypothetical protein